MYIPGLTLAEAEKTMILSALKFYGNNKERAADSLGITSRTIHNKLALYNGTPEPEVHVATEMAPEFKLTPLEKDIRGKRSKAIS